MTSLQPPAAGSGVVDGVDVDAVHAAVLACEGVIGTGSSLPGALATYLPGRRITGIRVNPDSVELEVRTRWGVSAVVAASDIRAGLEPMVGGRRIDVTLVDIELPGEDPLGPIGMTASPDSSGQPAETLTLPRPESEIR